MMPEFSARSEPITRLISGRHDLIIPATTGERTIACATDIFPVSIDPDFTNFGLDIPSAPTPATPVAVHEMIRDGDFRPVFGDYPVWFMQDQVIAFIETHPAWLHPNVWSTFFPFMVGEERFVAGVFRYSGGRLSVSVLRFARGYVWNAGHRGRLVIPQLTTSLISNS